MVNLNEKRRIRFASIRVRVAPVPIFSLLALVGSCEVVFLAMIFDEEALPDLILMIVPMMIVLVFPVIDTAVLLRGRGGDEGCRREQSDGQKKGR